MLAVQHELILPICGGALEAPVADVLEEYDFVGGVWGVRRPGHFPTASGAAKTAALGPVTYMLGCLLPAAELRCGWCEPLVGSLQGCFLREVPCEAGPTFVTQCPSSCWAPC